MTDNPNRATPLPQMAFIYKLNAMERASSEREPAKGGYAEARAAVLEYVATLERQRDEAREKLMTLNHAATEQVAELTTRAREAERRADSLAEDAERLDWLEGEMQRETEYLNARHQRTADDDKFPHSLFRRNVPITRAAIDAARAESNGGEGKTTMRCPKCGVVQRTQRPHPQERLDSRRRDGDEAVSRFSVTEGIAGYYVYHLSLSDGRTRSLCGKPTMHTSLSVAQFGVGRPGPASGPLNGRWCDVCPGLKAELEKHR